MKCRVLYIFCCCYLIAVFGLHGQNIHHVGVEDGLRDRKVTNLFQDSRGIFWINTDPGLHIYTGHEVRFHESPVNKLGYSGYIIEDDHGHIFYANTQGISVIDLYSHAENSILEYESKSGLFIHADGYIRIFIEDKVFTFKDEKWQELSIESEIIAQKLQDGYHVHQMNDGRYQLRGMEKENLLLDSDYNVVFESDKTAHEASTDDQGGWLITDQGGNLWMNYRYGRFRYWNAQDSMYRMSTSTIEKIDHVVVAERFPDEPHFTLLGDRKILGLDPKKDSVFLIANLPSIDNEYEMLIKDMNGSYVVAGNFGFYIVSFTSPKFHTILDTISSNIPYANSTKLIRDIGNDSLLISTKEHEYLYDIKHKSFSIFNQYTEQIYGADVIDNENIIAASGRGIVEINPKALRSVLRRKVTNGIRNMKSMFKHNSGYLIGNKRHFLRVAHDLSSYESIKPWNYSTVNSFYEEDENNLWLSTANGLVLMDSILKEKSVYNTHSYPSLLSNYINSVIEIDNEIWISTEKGIQILNKKINTCRTFLPGNRFLENTVYATIPTKDEKIWIPTDIGLGYYDKVAKNIVVFTQKDGLSHYEFNSNSQLIYKDKLYLGTLNGVTVIDLKNEFLNEAEIPIFINNVTVYNRRSKQVKQKEILGENPIIDVYPTESSLKFQVGMAHYDSPNFNILKYKIRDLHDEWQLIHKNTIEVGNLPAGKYEISIMGVASDGTISTKRVKATILFHRSILHSWWFIFLLILGITSILWIFYRWRLKQMNKVLQVKQRISANLHDEVGSIMTRIAFESDLIQSDIYSEAESKNRLKSIAEQSREATSVMSDIVWSFNANNDSLDSLLTRMKQHMYDMLNMHNISFQLKSETLDPRKNLDAIFRQNIYLIFKEAIHNVVKHSNADIVKVDLKYEKNIFSMIIEDDGTKTIDKGYSSSGMGLNNMKERAKSIQANMVVKKDDGYRIEITKRMKL